MRALATVLAALCAATSLATRTAAQAPAQAQTAGTQPWHISGDLSEACSCAAPCTCNFGEAPSPHAFCWAVFSLDIKQGSYGGTRLEGLRLAGAGGAKGLVVYVDERATPEQAAALRQIATTMWLKALKANGVKSPEQAPQEFRLLGVKRARIEQEVGERGVALRVGDQGGFTADYIIGLDGKTPVVVENNWSWNIQHGIKGKTKQLRYHDGYGNRYDLKQTNANQGKFDWSDATPVYFR